MQSLCTLRNHCRQWPRNTRYQADATPYLGRTFTGWIAPACGWRTYSITSSACAGNAAHRLSRRAVPEELLDEAAADRRQRENLLADQVWEATLGLGSAGHLSRPRQCLFCRASELELRLPTMLPMRVSRLCSAAYLHLRLRDTAKQKSASRPRMSGILVVESETHLHLTGIMSAWRKQN